MKRMCIAMVVFAVLLVFPIIISDGDSDAIEDGTVAYCYGDKPILGYQYEMRPGMEISWDVTGENGVTRNLEGESVTVDLSGEPYGSRVQVVQSVYYNGILEDTATMYLIPLHIEKQHYNVTFIDGSRVYTQAQVTETTVVLLGQDHVLLPAPPTKDGYRFEGWYTDQKFTEKFDTKAPVTGDTMVYAKWSGSGSGGSTSTKVVYESYTITFQTSVGLECTVVSQTAHTVVFSVSVVGGYALEGDVLVSTDEGTIEDLGDMTYRLYEVYGNAKVTITGDVEPIPSPNPPDPQLPEGGSGHSWVWIILLIAIILMICATYTYYRSRKDDEGSEMQ